MRVLLVIALAACSTPRAGGPAWPRSSGHEADGGESLEPHAARTVTATVADEDRAPDRPADRPQAASTGAPPAASAGSAAAQAQASDEVQPSEEIVIEIDD